MESPIKERIVIDIGQTVEKHVSFVSELLPTHALTGCDTVACCYGVGKGTALKVLKEGHSLSLLGVIDSPIEAVIAQATTFISACYGQYSMMGIHVRNTLEGLGIKNGSNLCSTTKTLFPSPYK